MTFLILLAAVLATAAALYWHSRYLDARAQLAGERALRRAGLPRDIDAEVSAEFEAAELERMWRQ